MARQFRMAVISVIIAVPVLITGCQRKVEVETGKRVLCSYGHTISDDVRTVKVPVKEAVDRYIRTEVTTCDKHAQIEKLYQEAQAAIDKGDLASARAKLTQIVGLDKSYGDAARQLAEIDAKKTPVADDGGSAPTGGSSTGGSGGGSGDDPAATPAGKLSIWTPASLKGYRGAELLVDVFTVTRDYRPDSKDRVALLVILAEQQRTSVGANALMTKMVKQPCPYDATTVSVKGRKAYFGTDNKRLATLAFTEGPVMVAIQMASMKDGDAKNLKSDLVDIANQLP